MKYNLRTRGTFKALPIELTKQVVDSNFPAIVCIHGHRLIRDHVSRNSLDERSSVYYRSTDGNILVRIADHWSAGSQTINCHRIASCYWVIKGNVPSYRGYVSGIIRINDLRYNNRLK